MKIQEANKNNFKDLNEIESSSRHHKRKFDVIPYLKELYEEGGKIFYARNKQNIIGYITLSKKGEISFLAVSKKYHRKGIASKLMEKTISYAKNKKIKKLFLDVRNDNLPAIILYLKNKFKIVQLYQKKINNKKITKLRLERELK